MLLNRLRRLSFFLVLVVFGFEAVLDLGAVFGFGAFLPFFDNFADSDDMTKTLEKMTNEVRQA
ncbi:MAG: hypothetical protein KDB00_19465 [Planctomycetales bacterium]|nr:hypothetical protein [Planctomycetales bacterium]